MGMSPDMFFEPSFGGSMAGDAGVMAVFGVLAIFYLIVALLSLALSVVIYIFHSLGLYTIANRRGIHHSWLAWLPVGNLWLLGSIADQYQYVVKGKIKNRRKVMLGLSIAVFAVYILCFVGGIVAGIIAGFSDNSETAGVGLVLVLVLLLVAIFVIAIVLAIFQYISYHNLFASCNPNNADLFLVLSIVFPVTLSFFVFACRKKDMGMPPKKTSVQAEPVLLTEEVAKEAEVVETEAEVIETEVEEGFAKPEEFED